MNKNITGAIAIMAVRNVEKTSQLLINLLNWKSMHGGSEFDILMDQNNVATLLLHAFESHDHKRFNGIHNHTIGIGISLYVFPEKDISEVYEKVKEQNLQIIEPLFENANSKAKEFTFKLSEGHQISVCDTGQWIYYGL
ncbi:MAG: hypothetical protein AAF518_01475 [Spirochaetota bacterium]